MHRTAKATIRVFVVSIAGLAIAYGASGTEPPEPPAAPLPAQILNARRVFVSNAGQENLETHWSRILSGAPDRLYNQFYAGLASWGRYELAPSPSAADLVLEIRFTLGYDIKVPELGRLRVAIRDPRSNVLLWAFTRNVGIAIRQGNRDKNLDAAVDLALSDLKELAARPR
jgi:hypothetical protein